MPKGRQFTALTTIVLDSGLLESGCYVVEAFALIIVLSLVRHPSTAQCSMDLDGWLPKQRLREIMIHVKL